MAGAQISTSVTIIDSLHGYQALSLTEYTTSAACSIAAGSVVEIAGAFFTFASDEAINASSWTAIVSATTAYIQLTPSGTAGSQIVMASYTATAPAWRDDFQGWYTSVGSSIRVVGSVYKESLARYIGKSILDSVKTASLLFNTTGSYNVAMGQDSLIFNTTGNYNVAIGGNSLLKNTIGIENTSIGYNSLIKNTEGNYNTAIGGISNAENTTGSLNCAIGASSLLGNTTGSYNVAMGSSSLISNTTGNYNTSIGSDSSGALVSGNYNTSIGNQSGGVLVSGSNNTSIGYNSSSPSTNSSNIITLGNSYIATLRCQQTSITALSDKRDKTDIKDSNLGIDFINALRPVTFKWDKREWYDNLKTDGSKKDDKNTLGFIAQELDEVQNKFNADFLNLVLKDNPEKLEATPGNILPILVKAIQELSKKIVELENK